MQDNNNQQKFIFPEPVRATYRENVRKTILKNGGDVSKLDAFPEAALDRLMVQHGFRKAAVIIGSPEVAEAEMLAKRDNYRQAIRRLIQKMGGDVNKFDNMPDRSLFNYYARLHRTKRGVAKAIMEFDWDKYREEIRQEVIRQGGDPKELDNYTGDRLRFYRDEYRTVEAVAQACIHHYR